MHRPLTSLAAPLFLSALFLAPGLAPAAESAASPPRSPKDEPIRLFDGKSLDMLTTRLRDTGSEDPRRVFTVHDGLLHISGDGFGCVTSKEAYRDYHLVLEFRWGPRTWGNRKTRAKDSGVFFHCTGPVDSVGGSWPEAFQAQMIHGGTGDFYVVKRKGPVPLAAVAEVEEREGKLYWKKGGERRKLTGGGVFWPGKDPGWKNELGFRGKNDVESPDGEWTRLEVICKGADVVIRVNGVQVNEAFELSPSAGKILVQCEGAELFIRRWELWPLGRAPMLPPIRPKKR